MTDTSGQMNHFIRYIKKNIVIHIEKYSLS
jgi:hypothetical protein